MAYVTSDDVISRLGGTAAATQYTTESGDTPDTDVIEEFIVQAEARVMSTIRKRTAVTISEADHPQTWHLIRAAVFAIVMFGVAGRRPPVPPDWKDAHTATEKWLETLTTDKATLPDVELNKPTVEYGGADQNAAAWRG